MSKIPKRVVVAAPTKQRLPLGSLGTDSPGCTADAERFGPALIVACERSSSPAEPTQRRGKPGRPAKNQDAKAKPVTVTLFSREYDGLDRLINAVHAHFGLPDNMVPRSKIARLAILRLMELKPEEVWEELKRLDP